MHPARCADGDPPCRPGGPLWNIAHLMFDFLCVLKGNPSREV